MGEIQRKEEREKKERQTHGKRDIQTLFVGTHFPVMELHPKIIIMKISWSPPSTIKK